MFIVEVKTVLAYVINTCLNSEITNFIRVLTEHLKPLITVTI
jgi:hypothetical protein